MNGSIQSVQRAAAILRSFTEQTPELGVMELSRRLNLHKSTISRLLTTLQGEGLVDQNPKTGRYRLGLGLVSLAGVALGRIDIRGVAQPLLTPLLAEVQETITIGVLEGREAVIVERLASPRVLRYVGWIGRRIPLYCTAAGRILLAWLPPGGCRELLPEALYRYTKYTCTDLDVLEQQFAQIRAAGYAVVQEEFEAEITAIASPVRDHAGCVVAAIEISGPTNRLDSETIGNFAAHLIATTGEISAALGYAGQPTPVSPATQSG